MNAIETHNLTKYYGEARGIQDVNLTIATGEVFGFIGPNGAGKSTTIRTLLGLLPPTSGSAKIFGKDIVEHGHDIRRKIGYLPSEVNYYDEMTSRELLEYHMRFYGEVNHARIEELAAYFELDLNRKITDLSLGNKKKCAILQTILHEPELLILDEPTSGLDPLMQNRFFDLLEDMNKKGATLFFSSHVLSEIQRICDRAAIIRNGEIIAVEEINTLLKKQMKKVHLLFEEKDKNLTLIEGAHDALWHGNKLHFNYVGTIQPLLHWMKQLPIADATMEEPDLEAIFMNYYTR